MAMIIILLPKSISQECYGRIKVLFYTDMHSQVKKFNAWKWMTILLRSVFLIDWLSYGIAVILNVELPNKVIWYSLRRPSKEQWIQKYYKKWTLDASYCATDQQKVPLLLRVINKTNVNKRIKYKINCFRNAFWILIIEENLI